MGVELLRPSFKRERKRPGEPRLKKVRQLIESVNDTPKASSTWNNTATMTRRLTGTGTPTWRGA
ncbi:hypothetical protein [Embleya sp. NBC_00896]|uniref:hypothetical protein n=1 Tax=Embleya sp. NBC_00896 TaxID=2975961 RepID=UPI003870A4E0|nr:hypothetical protein OG928_04455 [Embleya sp. NBC_00896]